jgi:hypothetical protein
VKNLDGLTNNLVVNGKVKETLTIQPKDLILSNPKSIQPQSSMTNIIWNQNSIDINSSSSLLSPRPNRNEKLTNKHRDYLDKNRNSPNRQQLNI